MGKDNCKTRGETIKFWFGAPYIRDLTVHSAKSSTVICLWLIDGLNPAKFTATPMSKDVWCIGRTKSNCQDWQLQVTLDNRELFNIEVPAYQYIIFKMSLWGWSLKQLWNNYTTCLRFAMLCCGLLPNDFTYVLQIYCMAKMRLLQCQWSISENCTVKSLI